MEETNKKSKNGKEKGLWSMVLTIFFLKNVLKI